MNGEKNEEIADQPRPMYSDVLHWSASLECWAVENEQGVLWVSRALFLREVNRILAHAGTPHAVPSSRQYADAADTVQDPAYWETINDPGVTRFAAGEAPHGNAR